MIYPEAIETVCYDHNHIDQVLSEIRINFIYYFDDFLATKAGTIKTAQEFAELAQHFHVDIKENKKNHDRKASFIEIIDEAIKEFEKDRPKYINILDETALNEYEDDPKNFKSTVLRNACPIIHNTLQNKIAKELDKYRAEFNAASPKELLKVVRNLTKFAIQYLGSYDANAYESFRQLGDLGLADLDGEDYIVYGVIGGGIKSHLLYKLNPSVFPNRSREAVWSLWYLTAKNKFNCKQDSEFLMINLKDYSTQQNYFYPYQLFAFYAYNVYLLLKNKAEEYGISIDPDYRYVVVNAFLSYVAEVHAKEIAELSKKETAYGY